MALVYVGGRTGTWAGATTGNNNISLTLLSGGISSTAAIGDIVIAVYATGSAADRTLAIQTPGGTAYTLIGTELYSNGTTYDSNLRVAYRILTAADANTVFGPTGNNADAGAAAVHVWRGIDPTTPLDVAATTATGTGTGRPNPPAITPVTPGAVVLATGGAGAATGALFVGTGLSNFITATSIDTNDGMVGVGSFAWTSGAYDPAAWTGGTTGAADAWTALTLALRPFIAQINAEAGSFTYTGQDATLARSRNFNAESGTFTYTGQDAFFSLAKNFNAEAGTFSYLGQDATLNRTYSFNAEAGTFSYLGQDATLAADRAVDAEDGAFTYTGQNANLAAARSLNAESGTFTYTGQNATLDYVPSAKILVADAGDFAYTGQNATLSAARFVNAEAGSFAYTGQNAELIYTQVTREIDAEAGSFAYTGQNATLLAVRSLNAEAAAFGEANPYVDPGYVDPYYSTNLTAALGYGRAFNAAAGSFTYTGQNASLITGTLYPPEADVKAGVVYGPGGIYVGTYAPAGKQPIYVFDD